MGEAGGGPGLSLAARESSGQSTVGPAPAPSWRAERGRQSDLSGRDLVGVGSKFGCRGAGGGACIKGAGL